MSPGDAPGAVEPAAPFAERYDLITRAWLERRFAHEDERGVYVAHEAIYGFGQGPTEGGHHRRSTRLFDLLVVILGLEPASFLDVGAAEGCLAALVRRFADARVAAVDISTVAARRAAAILGVPALACNAARLPFPDDAFEVVALTEVVEHLGDPVSAILEAQRVASRFVVISTEEWHEDEELRRTILAERRLENHMERNVFTAADLAALFPAGVTRRAQRFPTPAAEGRAIADPEALCAFLEGGEGFTEGGVLLVASAAGDAPPPWPRIAPELRRELCHTLFEGLADPEDQVRARPSADDAARDVLAGACCPLCRGALDDRPACTRCTFRGARVDGIADLYVFVEPETNLAEAARALDRPPENLPALAELHRRFVLEPAGRTRWTHADLRDPAEPWYAHDLEIGDDALTATGRDPQIWSPWIGVELDRIGGVYLRGAVTSGPDPFPVELFFQIAGDAVFTQENATAAGIAHAELARGVVVPLPEALRARGRHLVRLRIDPGHDHPGDVVRLDEIALTPPA